MMDVDDVHRTLEQHFKPLMYTHYIERMDLAKNKQPYILFTKTYQKLFNNFCSIRPQKNWRFDCNPGCILFKVF